MRKTIERQLLLHGFYPMLIALEEMERREEFEICKIIINVLRETGEEIGYSFPEKISEQASSEMKLIFMVEHGMSGNIAHKNSPAYAKEIIKQIDLCNVKIQ